MAPRQEAELVLQTGHRWGVSCSAFSPDGRTLATSSRDGTVKLWDIPTRRLTRTLVVGRDGATALSWSADGSRLACSDDARALRIWSHSGELLHRIQPTDKEELHTVALGRGRDAFVAGHSFYVMEHPSRGGSTPGSSVEYRCFVRSQNVDTSRGEWTTLLDWDDVEALATAPDFTTVVATGYARRNHAGISSGEMAILDGASGKVRWSITLPTAEMAAAVFSTRSPLLAVSGMDYTDKTGKVWLWDTAARRLLHVLSLGALEAPSIGFAPDSGTLVVGLAEGRELPGYGLVQYWDARTGKLRRQWRDDRLASPQVAVSPVNGLVVVGAQTASYGAALVLLAPGTANPVAVLPGGASGIRSAEASPDGKRLAFSGGDGELLVWERDTGKLRQLAPPGLHTYRPFEWDHSGSRLVAGAPSGALQILDPSGSAAAVPLAGQPGFGFSLSFSPDGNRVIGFQLRDFTTDSLVLGRRLTGDTWLWDAHTGRLITRLLVSDSLRFSPSGKYLVGFSAHEDGELGRNYLGQVEPRYRATFTVWDAGSGALVRDLGAATGYRILESSDRVLLADDSGFAVCDLDDGMIRHIAQAADRFTVSADGTRLLTAVSSGTVHLMDIRSGHCLFTQPAPNAPLRSVDLAPDGKTAVFGLDRSGAVLLNVESGETKVLAAEGARELRWIQFLPGGGAVVGSDSDNLYLWHVWSGRLALSVPEVLDDATSPDGRSLVVVTADGLLHVYDVSTGKKRITLASFEANVGNPRWEWLAYTPDGGYTGSGGAERFIAWRMGNRLLSGNALRREHQVPDLLKRVPWSLGKG